MLIGLWQHFANDVGCRVPSGSVFIDSRRVSRITMRGCREYVFGQNDRFKSGPAQPTVAWPDVWDAIEHRVERHGLIGIYAPEVDVRAFGHVGGSFSRDIGIVMSCHSHEFVWSN